MIMYAKIGNYTLIIITSVVLLYAAFGVIGKVARSTKIKISGLSD